MNSHYTEVSPNLMENAQRYDDSHLKRKMTCLTSGQLLCFVIGVAALGISIVLLLKFDNEEAHHSSISLTMKEEIADLHTQIDQLKKQVYELQGPKQIQAAHGSIPMSETTSEIGRPTGEDDRAHEGHHHAHSDHSHHAGHSEEHSEEEETESESHVEDGLADTSSETSNGHSPIDGGVVEEEITPFNCDDPDLCPSLEGSGFNLNHIEDVLEPFYIDGSGDYDEECMQFSRPVCPEGVNICLQGDKCPVPVCCFEDKPKTQSGGHQHHHHH